MESTARVQILDEADGVLFCDNALEKGKNLCVLSSAIDEIIKQTEFFSLGKVTSLGKGKLNFKKSRTSL